MNKNMLETGMYVRMRNSDYLYLVIRDCNCHCDKNVKDIGFVSRNGYMRGSEYKDDLTSIENNNYDIMEILTNVSGQHIDSLTIARLNNKIPYKTKSIWKREEKREFRYRNIKLEMEPYDDFFLITIFSDENVIIHRRVIINKLDEVKVGAILSDLYKRIEKIKIDSEEYYLKSLEKLYSGSYFDEYLK